MSHTITLYRQAALHAQAHNWPQATASLHCAYRDAPPDHLTDEDCQHLWPYLDDLAVVGQQLPCLRGTIRLLTRLRDLAS